CSTFFWRRRRRRVEGRHERAVRRHSGRGTAGRPCGSPARAEGKQPGVLGAGRPTVSASGPKTPGSLVRSCPVLGRARPLLKQSGSSWQVSGKFTATRYPCYPIGKGLGRRHYLGIHPVARERALLEAHGKEWRAALPPLSRVRWWEGLAPGWPF